jgi:hypothetical protein
MDREHAYVYLLNAIKSGEDSAYVNAAVSALPRYGNDSRGVDALSAYLVSHAESSHYVLSALSEMNTNESMSVFLKYLKKNSYYAKYLRNITEYNAEIGVKVTDALLVWLKKGQVENVIKKLSTSPAFPIPIKCVFSDGKYKHIVDEMLFSDGILYVRDENAEYIMNIDISQASFSSRTFTKSEYWSSYDNSGGVHIGYNYYTTGYMDVMFYVQYTMANSLGKVISVNSSLIQSTENSSTVNTSMGYDQVIKKAAISQPPIPSMEITFKSTVPLIENFILCGTADVVQNFILN